MKMDLSHSTLFARPGSREQLSFCQYVANEIAPRGWDYRNTAGLGSFRGGKLVGATVFHDWNPEAGVMCMSGAGKKGWLTLAHAYKAHRYIFGEAGCQLAVMQVGETNTAMRKAAEKFGYTGHFIPRLRGRDEGEYVYTLTEEDWKAHRFTQRFLKQHPEMV